MQSSTLKLNVLLVFKIIFFISSWIVKLLFLFSKICLFVHSCKHVSSCTQTLRQCLGFFYQYKNLTFSSVWAFSTKRMHCLQVLFGELSLWARTLGVVQWWTKIHVSAPTFYFTNIGKQKKKLANVHSTQKLLCLNQTLQIRISWNF